jgi:hypothetical protein
MPIEKGDVKLVKSVVMDDVPEGGQGPTANVIADGASNAIFPDVSESDRAAGRVSLRKVHVMVQSDDTDTYLGGNIIVAEPPNDPNVSVTLFSTGATFDDREAARARLEAYLNVGPNYAGYLYGNHIVGMKSVLIYQRTSDMPGVGTTLALTKREGFGDQYVQYVRITEQKIAQQTFTDDRGDFQRYVMELKISDPLRQDMAGFDVARIDPTKAQLAAATKVSTSLVADSANYAGVQPLAEAAGVADFTVKAAGIFTQLVPSAQIETPIGDARTNQLANSVTRMGATVTVDLSLSFTTTQSLYIGGAIAPNTLSIVNGAITVTDSGGRLMSAGSQVGLVDYENGVVSLTTNVFGTSPLTFAVTYAPAAVPDSVTQSQGYEVTIEGRSLAVARTLQPVPVPGSLSISYMVGSRWYVLRDDGSGAVRGADSSFGAAQLNLTTGNVVGTLGALPDVGSQVIFQWNESDAARNTEDLQLVNLGKFYWPFNTSGEVSTAPGTKSITPGALTITWSDGGTRTVTDNGAGVLQGYGTGTVDYGAGIIRLSPTTLPPVGTMINIATTQATKLANTPTLTTSGSTLLIDFLATGITPGTVVLSATAQMRFKWFGETGTPPFLDWGVPSLWQIVDNGTGTLLVRFGNDLKVAVGSINYAAGTGVINLGVVLFNPMTDLLVQDKKDAALQATAFDNVYQLYNSPLWVYRSPGDSAG